MTIMLYDGNCGLCAASVQFILRHERTDSLRFATLQGEVGRDVRARHPDIDGVDSMVWVVEADGGNGERVAVRSAAVIEAARYLGGPWSLAVMGTLLPPSLRDEVYDLVARHRHRLLRAPDQCYVPSPETRTRFLDSDEPPSVSA